MVKEVGELRLEDRLPEWELRESKNGEDDGDMSRRVPWLPLYRVRGQVMYKEEGSPDWGVVSLREGT
jgi:hypothetical protein